MQASKQFTLHQQTLWLSPERCIYWEEESTLILSDLHFGKTGHFRKSGIAVPQNMYKEDLQRLIAQVQYFKPQQMVVVGDLFHSVANKELQLFKRWRNDISQLEIKLIRGNHDILAASWYDELNIRVSPNHLAVANFCFIHDIQQACEASPAIDYYFSGHIHPCITIRGLGRQAIRLPCFYFNQQFAVLPAFGKFTGTAPVEQLAGDTVFAIVAPNAAKGQHGSVIKM